jgi:hypothetical protein
MNMNNKENFVAYEYKNVTVKRDSAAMYIDCMSNFGWTPIEDEGLDIQSVLSNLNPVHLGMNIANTAQAFAETPDGSETVTLKFKRDRRIENKRELDNLERKCVEALSAVNRIERKNNAQTMGVSLGTGIVGTAFIGLAVYNFVFSHVALGVLFAAVGAVGWAIGFFSNRRIGTKKAVETEPHIQEQFDIAYNACEQAHALLT